MCNPLKSSFILSAALILLSGVASLAPAQETGPFALVRVQGNKFVDGQGKEIIFRGIAFSDPDKLEKSGHWNDEYFRMAKEWGANIVRIPVHPDAWRSRGVKAYLSLLDQGVQLAKKYNLIVIMDWHSIGNLKTEQFQSPNYDTTMKETLSFWRTISVHYKNEPIVAFYEIYNEPTTYHDELGPMSWSEWKSIAETIIVLVKANDPKAIPLVGGLDWAYDLTKVATEPINIPGIAYTTHPYPQKREEPWEPKWEADWGFVKDKYPVIATEFGWDKRAHIPCIATLDYGKHIIDYFNSKGISWTVWCFDPDWEPWLIRDWKYTPTEQGEFFRAELQKRARE